MTVPAEPAWAPAFSPVLQETIRVPLATHIHTRLGDPIPDVAGAVRSLAL